MLISQRNAVPLPQGQLRPHRCSQVSHQVKAFSPLLSLLLDEKSLMIQGDLQQLLVGNENKTILLYFRLGSRVVCVSDVEQLPFPWGSPLLLIIIILILVRARLSPVASVLV